MQVVAFSSYPPILEHACLSQFPSLNFRCPAEIKKKKEHISFMGMQTTEQRKNHNQNLSASVKYLLLYIREYHTYSSIILSDNSNQQLCSLTMLSLLPSAGDVVPVLPSVWLQNRQQLALGINFQTQLLGIHIQMLSVCRLQRSQEDLSQEGRTIRMCCHVDMDQSTHKVKERRGARAQQKPRVQTAGQSYLAALKYTSVTVITVYREATLSPQ